VPQLTLPAGLPVQDGSPATLQVVTLGADGNALYNCADIVFRANATGLAASNCTNDQGVSVTTVAAQGQGQNGSSSSGGAGKNAAPAAGVSVPVMTSVVALTVLFVLGMSM
jgi:hypothetical protein